MVQPTCSGEPKPEYAELISAIYDIGSAARRHSRSDPLDTGSVRLLWHVAGVGDCRPSDLADAASLDLSTISRHIRALETAGYLRRAPDPRDGRACSVSVTESGHEVLQISLSNRVSAIGPVLDSWLPTDRTTLTTLLRRLADDLVAHGVKDSV